MGVKRERVWPVYPTVPLFLLFLSILVTLSLGHSNLEREAQLQNIFQLRNEDEWKFHWHSEKHARCRDQLLVHMDWACQKDIYRLDKKITKPTTGGRGRDPYPPGIFVTRAVGNTVIKPWSGYVARRKRENKSITDECCNTAGCTWEEYAEYCPAHRRARMVRSRNK